MKILCVLNPRAAGGLAMERWPGVAQLLRAFRADYDLLADESAPIDLQLIRRFEEVGPSAYSAVAGIGGDGTHSALINGLMRYRAAHPESSVPPYAFVPLGTGNDIAQSFGLTSREDFFVNDLRRAVSTIIHGADYWLDLGVLEGRYFADALTVGLDSRILHERNVRKRRIERIPLLRCLARGKFLYTISTGVQLWRHRPAEAQITVDGVPWYAGPMINLVVNNTRVYAGVFEFSPDTYANDGRLDVVLFTDERDYLKRYLLAIRHHPDRILEFSSRLSRMSAHVQGCRIAIRLKRPEAVQLDGEEIGSAEALDIGVHPRAIHIKTPAEPA